MTKLLEMLLALREQVISVLQGRYMIRLNKQRNVLLYKKL